MNAVFRSLFLVVPVVVLAACDTSSSTDAPPPPAPIDPTAWTQVRAVPTDIVDTVLADGDVAYAASNNRVFASGDRGGSWREVTPLDTEAVIVSLAAVDGRLFAGTLGRGVFESPDAGRTWTPRNDGLTGASALRILAFAVRGARLYAGTDGAGVLVLDLSANTGWIPFRSGMPSNLSWNVGDVVLAGTRLVAGAGGNGSAYLNDNASDTWREVLYDVDRPGALRIVFDAETIGPAQQPVVVFGTTMGMYRSSDGGETWRRSELDAGALSNASIARSGTTVFAALTNDRRGTRLLASDDWGATWRLVVEQPGVFVTDLRVLGERLYAGRVDGLWSLPLSATRPA